LGAGFSSSLESSESSLDSFFLPFPFAAAFPLAGVAFPLVTAAFPFVLGAGSSSESSSESSESSATALGIFLGAFFW
jgi:hypothetical protein